MKRGFRVIDTDLHLMEPQRLWTERISKRHQADIEIAYPGGRGLQETFSTRIRIGNVAWELGDGRATIRQQHFTDRFQEEPLLALMHSDGGGTAENTLRGMDIEGIDLAILVPTLLFVVTTADGLDPTLVAELCRAYNDYAADYCATDPDRLRFWGWLPRQSPELAAREARRCVEDLGAAGVAMTTGNVDGWNLSEPHFDPLWPTLNELGVPFGLHLYGMAPKLYADPPLRYLGRERTDVVSAVLQGSNQAMSAVAELCTSGVLERHPGVRPLVMETASTWLMWLLQRMDDQWELYRPYIDDVRLELKPSDYFRRQCAITAECDEDHLEYLATACGLADNLVFTTDFPHHDSNFPHAVDEFFELELSDDLRRKILSENAERAFDLTATPA